MRAFVLLAVVLVASAQTAVWESGLKTASDTPFSKSLSELPEVKSPSPTAAPGRSGHCSVWYDGAIYFFGGQRANAVSNDLWRYETSTGKWQFLLGAKEANHPGSSALPAARSGHSCVLEEGGTRFLLFGGRKSNDENLADVWAYSFLHNDWQSLSSGQRQASYTNGLLSHPGARTNHQAIYVAEAKSMVVFGGRSAQGLLSDVWQYQVEKGLWTFLGGSQKSNSQGVYPVYGKTNSLAAKVIASTGLAEPTPSPQPGGREFAHCARGASTNLVCYGGKGYAADNIVGLLADVWSFDIGSKQWSFVHGHTTHKVDVRPLYPKLNPNFATASIGGVSTVKKLQQYFRFRAGEAATVSHEQMHEAGTSCPGGRVGGVFGIDTVMSVAYVFGGQDADGKLLNDLWSFDLINKKWNLLRGTTVKPNYGTKGVATAGAFPPARAFSAGAITASAVNEGGKRFVIFSGQADKGVFGDLWSIELSKKAAKSNSNQKPAPSPTVNKDAKVNNPFNRDVEGVKAPATPVGNPDPKPFIPKEPPVATGEVPRTGCCNAKAPITVGPYNIPSTETREVQVLGDRENRPPIRVEIPDQTSWYKQHIADASKHLKTAGARIESVKSTHKKLRNRPLVEDS